MSYNLTMKLKFINHASYILENDNTILLHDPWLEGDAFNNGWSLLSKEIKNKDLVNYLKDTKKDINIWISHEHSDHFSISFIKSLKAAGVSCSYFFHETTDKRVIRFLQLNDLNVTECTEGKEYRLDNEFYLSVYAYPGGDSFCYVRTNKQNILNINDCVINDENQAMKVLARLPNNSNVDILFTQFGYANWIGRSEDINLRLKSAEEKFTRIDIQNKIFNPKTIIPFASFIYFCKKDNFYMNDQQNFPNNLRKSNILQKIQKKINFMKPNQEVALDDHFLQNLQNNTLEAEKYWDSSKSKIKNKDGTNNLESPESVSAKDIAALGKKYVSGVRQQTLGMVTIFEFLKLFGLAPIHFHIYDLDINYSLSYISGIKKQSNIDTDLSIHSSELAFILKNEFGWNTLHVSGAFKASRSDISNVLDFFRWQDAIKNGFSFKNPMHSMRVALHFIQNKLFN